MVNVDCGDVGAESIANAPHLSQLVSLELSCCGLTDQAAIAIAEARHLDDLTVLDLSCNEIGDRGALALAHSSRLPSLKSVHLDDRLLSNATAEVLRERYPVDESA